MRRDVEPIYTLALRSRRFYHITDATGRIVWSGTNKRKALKRVKKLLLTTIGT